MAVGESRTELLLWLNETLQLDYPKVEKCGTGAAFCQLMDSIFGDVPMGKVKFDANNEYDYRINWKVLQASFNKHKVTKNIDVEKLMKCRLQDNLELLQWFKRYWNENKDFNHQYDANYRRKSGPSAPTTGVKQVLSRVSSNSLPSRTSSNSVSSRNSSNASITTSRRSTLNTPTTSASGSRRVSSNGRSTVTPAQPSIASDKLSKQLIETQKQLATVSDELQEYKISADSLETERNFYFNKLREIEVLTQNIIDMSQNKSDELKYLDTIELTKKIQSILYSTEEGFQLNNDYDENMKNEDDDFESF
jgi:RP/EB family microtubule-associated protein